MRTCKIRNMDYQGPTRNPNGAELERLTRRYSRIRNKDAFKRLAVIWGLLKANVEG